MSKENIENTMRDFIKALYATKDIEKALSLCTEDADWVTPQGTFRGKEEFKRYLKWMLDISPDMACTDSGVGIIVNGNKAVYEHLVSGTIQGMQCQVPVMCAYEFSNGRIQHIRTVLDRLGMVKQAAKGWLPKIMVNSIVKQTEKGL